MWVIIDVGIKDLILVLFFLMGVMNDMVIEVIKVGMIMNIISLGMWGFFGDFVLYGGLKNFVIFCFYGNWVWVIEYGDIKIDVVFLGVLNVDWLGNVNGMVGKVVFGFLGYVLMDV